MKSTRSEEKCIHYFPIKLSDKPEHLNPIKTSQSPNSQFPALGKPKKTKLEVLRNHEYNIPNIRKAIKITQINLGLAGEPSPAIPLPPYPLVSKNLSARIWPLVGVDAVLCLASSRTLLFGLEFSFRLNELLTLSICEMFPSLRIDDLSIFNMEELSLGSVEELSVATWDVECWRSI